MKRLLTLVLLLVTTHTQTKETQNEIITLKPLPAQEQFEKILYSWTRTLGEVLHIIRTKYYIKNVDLTEPMIDAINTLLKSLDPHSSFLDPKAYNAIIDSTRGQFFGTGIIISSNKSNDDDFLVIIDVIPDGPADKAGVQAGDRIIEIDSCSLRSMTIDEATAKLKGERNSIVNVTIHRIDAPAPLRLSITRDTVKEQNLLCYYLPQHKIHYIALNIFSQNAVTQLEQVLKKIDAKTSRGLIVDLRNNAGGLLNAAVDIAGLFLPKNSLVVSTKDSSDFELDKRITTRDPVVPRSIPIVVLINQHTGSAAEILAGCLRVHSEAADRQRKAHVPPVFLVGSQSFGKGSVQEIIPVGNNCAAKTTIGCYFLADGTTLQPAGLTPDIMVGQKFPPNEQIEWVNTFYGRERALKNYIDPETKTRSKPAKSSKKSKEDKRNWKDKRKEAIASDHQLQSAIDLLNLLEVQHRCEPKSVNTREKALNFLQTHHVGDGTLELDEVSA